MSCLFGKLIFRVRLCLLFLPCHSYKANNKIELYEVGKKKDKFVLMIPLLHPSCAFFLKSKRAQKEEADVSSMRVFKITFW